jgi:heterotetrameric sarcosine oxidase delta subunit
MIEINCPWCGPRAQVEFSYGGAANRQRPADPMNASAAEWDAYVYERDNPKGDHEELWHHASGCRAWLKVRRNTVTHQITEVVGVGDKSPVGDKA